MAERLKMAILIRERTRMLDFFGMCLLLRYKAIGFLKKSGEGCQNLRFTAKNIFESVTWRPTVCYLSLRLLSVRCK